MNGARPADAAPATYPVLEIGGTHVTAALVTLRRDPTVGAAVRLPLDAQASAEHLLESFAAAGRRLGATMRSRWGIALPGPFDYARGIGRYRGVGKFDALDGVDVAGALRQRLGQAVADLAFVNDARAFLLGEDALGVAADEPRVMALTLGTGVGSAFLEHGYLVGSGPRVPPEGRVDLLLHDGAPLEDSFSQRAIRRAYRDEVRRRAAVADPQPDPEGADVSDVRAIAALARGGDPVARDVLSAAACALGTCIAPWVERFGATTLVIGGSMARSWDVLTSGFRAGLVGVSPSLAGLPVVRGRRLDDAPLIGAASHAARTGRTAGA